MVASVFDVITCTDAVLNLTYRNAHNKLTTIPADIPKGVVNIYLQDNQINTIIDYTFNHYGNCVQLRLDHNNLVRIKREMWTGLISLHWLNLSKNQIQHIEPESFIDLPELNGLYLSYNQLTTLSQDVFPANGSHPERLTLYGNPLQDHDDEELCWLHQGALAGSQESHWGQQRQQSRVRQSSPTTARLYRPRASLKVKVKIKVSEFYLQNPMFLTVGIYCSKFNTVTFSTKSLSSYPNVKTTKPSHIRSRPWPSKHSKHNHQPVK